MIGMLQILIYMFAAYFIFKAVEILQVALMSSRPNRNLGIVIGAVAIAVAIGLAGYFVSAGDAQARSVANSVGR